MPSCFKISAAVVVVDISVDGDSVVVVDEARRDRFHRLDAVVILDLWECRHCDTIVKPFATVLNRMAAMNCSFRRMVRFRLKMD
jgi:hypothetical protein